MLEILVIRNWQCAPAGESNLSSINFLAARVSEQTASGRKKKWQMKANVIIGAIFRPILFQSR